MYATVALMLFYDPAAAVSAKWTKKVNEDDQLHVNGDPVLSYFHKNEGEGRSLHELGKIRRRRNGSSSEGSSG